jgi:hypothetical protein
VWPLEGNGHKKLLGERGAGAHEFQCDFNGAGRAGALNATAAEAEVRGPRRDGAERRLRRGGARNKTAAAQNVRRPRREGAKAYIPTNKLSTAPWVLHRRFRRLICSICRVIIRHRFHFAFADTASSSTYLRSSCGD